MIIKKNIKNSTSHHSMLRSGKLMFLLGAMLMLSVGAFAQPENGDEGDPDAPFDGGVSLLVAAGVAYGAKQWRNARKSNKEQEEDVETKSKV